MEPMGLGNISDETVFSGLGSSHSWPEIRDSQRFEVQAHVILKMGPKLYLLSINVNT